MNDPTTTAERATPTSAHLLVVFVAAVTMMSRLWEGDLHRDEVLYAAVAKGIVTTGDWLNLSIGDDPYWNKPPLMFWLAAISYQLFGLTVFAAKLFPALFGVLSCLALYVLGRRLLDEPTALLSSVVLATIPRFVRTAATFRLDSAVVLFTLVALLLYLRAVEAPGRGRFAAAGASWGLAVMAKGAFGLIAPYVFVIYALVCGRFRALFSRGFVVSIVVACAVFVPWHLYEVASWGTPFLDTYLGREVFDRLTGTLTIGFEPTSYGWALVKDAWPWIAFMAAGALVALQLGLKGNRKALFVLAWAAGYLLLLYASQGRRARYLIPFYPPAALLAGMALARLLPVRWMPRLGRAIGTTFAAVAFALVVLPIPVHSTAATELRALGPVLDVLAPESKAPLVGFRARGLQVRALCLFYLDRDLHSMKGADIPRDGSTLVLTYPPHGARLERLGFTRLYENSEYTLLRAPTAQATTPPVRPPAVR